MFHMLTEMFHLLCFICWLSEQSPRWPPHFSQGAALVDERPRPRATGSTYCDCVPPRHLLHSGDQLREHFLSVHLLSLWWRLDKELGLPPDAAVDLSRPKFDVYYNFAVVRGGRNRGYEAWSICSSWSTDSPSPHQKSRAACFSVTVSDPHQKFLISASTCKAFLRPPSPPGILAGARAPVRRDLSGVPSCSISWMLCYDEYCLFRICIEGITALQGKEHCFQGKSYSFPEKVADATADWEWGKSVTALRMFLY